MLNGIDISHWNPSNIIETAMKDNKKLSFVICKATEGISYNDPVFYQRMDEALDKGLLVGAYHFANAYKWNTAEQEAVHFISTVKQYIGKAMLALDWEAENLKLATANRWVCDFCNVVYEATGVKPLLYVQQSAIKKYTQVQHQNIGLWAARYNKELGSVKPWKICALWQYTSTPYDKDYFYGTKEAWIKYASIDPDFNTEQENSHICLCHKCGCSCKEGSN